MGLWLILFRDEFILAFHVRNSYLVYNICISGEGGFMGKVEVRVLRAKIINKTISLQLTNYKSTKTYSLAYLCVSVNWL